MDNEADEIQGRLFGPTPEAARPGSASKAGRPGAVRGRRQEVTEAEEELLRAIGNQVAGPRFMMDVAADPETLELLDDLVAKGLVESTGYVLRPLPRTPPARTTLASPQKPMFCSTATISGTVREQAKSSVRRWSAAEKRCRVGFSSILRPDTDFSVEDVEIEVAQGVNGVRRVVERSSNGVTDTHVLGCWMNHSLFASQADLFLPKAPRW